MRFNLPIGGTLVLSWLIATCSLFAQTPASDTRQTQPGNDRSVIPVGTTRDVLGDSVAEPAPSLGFSPPLEQGQAAAVIPAPRFGVVPKFDYTFLPGGGADGFGINDFEGSAKFTFPLGDAAPLWVTPGGGVHLWAGTGTATPRPGSDLPPQVYDLYVDFAWRPRPCEWLFLDFVVTPGLYTDFLNLDSSAFRLRGRAVAIVALSERLQFALGALYTNRLRTTMLPAGGVIWTPNDDTKLSLLFPAPKVARRLACREDGSSWWAYLSGEFGGGTWAYRHESGLNDAVDYSDLRVILGVEALTLGTSTCHVEAGYVFGRLISLASTGTAGDVRPSSTILLRAGFAY